MYNVISYWLKYYRSECKLTQQDVADLLGLERSSYTYYETGKTTPDIETLIRLSKIFHVDFFDLLSGCNTETGKYVSDSNFKKLNDKLDNDDEEKFSEANFEAEILLRIRSLDEGKREEAMAFLDDLTDNIYKFRRKSKTRDVVAKPVEIPKKELELLERADVKYLPPRAPKKKRGRKKKNIFLDD
ncbi:helix-turn-helix transcriptional regulator [Candidatus Pseudoruminococcus sp.]|uniref:helix-turn-helix transcriptional regulator n=1 Tax=Candidatus Pseudoruminococcus sp. TaxID=3101048 RepID=UPI0039997DA4|nr:helix-turn-helix domain-containing protein [Ruminococcus sp.]